MFKCISNQNELEHVIKILEPQREKCLYLYCNILKYGLENDNFNVFIETNSNNIIGMYYGDSIHVFAPDGISNSILNFIKSNRPRTIFSSIQLLELGQYNEEQTGVYRLQNELIRNATKKEIRQLELQDIRKLTKFLYKYSSEYRKTYDEEKLEKQLAERLVTNYCRYFGKFDEKVLIGCAFTKAEINDVMIVGGILVSPEYRGLGLGKELCLQKGIIACRENKKAYCFIDDLNHVSIRLHKNVGYEKVDNVYKYTILKE